MINNRELLNDSVFQRELAENAESLFNIDKLLREPVVVLDRGPDEFWTTISNSFKRDLVLEKVFNGDIIPVNADALGDIAQVHSALHIYLAESERGIPTIPTIVNIIGRPTPVGRYQLPKETPGVYVKKTSYKDGRMTSHRGEGISIVRVAPSNLETHLPKNRWEFLQPFVVPPDEFVRDIRAYLVGGVPIAGVIRRARKPLLPENLTGEVLPTQEQYPSAQYPGPNERLDGDLKDKVYSRAVQIVSLLDEKVRARARPFSPYITFGFGSIDFLLDANRTPLPVDFDVNPSVTKFEDIDQVVAKALASFLQELSDLDGKGRKILLIGYPNDEFIEKVLINLRDKLPDKKLVFQESIVSQAMKQRLVSQERSSLKTGRNDPCPCGSGKKYKKCCHPS